MERIINVTPHPITFRKKDGTDFVVPPSGFLCGAKAVEKVVGGLKGEIEIVETLFEVTREGLSEIDEIIEKFPGAIIIGSIISAQAYPGLVMGMTPSPGFERVPPNEKRMNPYKFTTF